MIHFDQGSICRGGDRGLGHGSISENPNWVTYRNAQKWRFLAPNQTESKLTAVNKLRPQMQEYYRRH